jgi:hypothetical protein
MVCKNTRSPSDRLVREIYDLTRNYRPRGYNWSWTIHFLTGVHRLCGYPFVDSVHPHRDSTALAGLPDLGNVQPHKEFRPRWYTWSWTIYFLTGVHRLCGYPFVDSVHPHRESTTLAGYLILIIHTHTEKPLGSRSPTNATYNEKSL